MTGLLSLSAMLEFPASIIVSAEVGAGSPCPQIQGGGTQAPTCDHGGFADETMIKADCPMRGSSAFPSVVRELLERGKSVRFQVRGVSMRPWIRNGDLITASPLSGPVRFGDVVLYCLENDRFFIHRVLWRAPAWAETKFFIKGDACFSGPDMVPMENILARVVAVERQGRKTRLDSLWRKIVGGCLAGATRLIGFVLGR